jgi:hypothetical protein
VLLGQLKEISPSPEAIEQWMDTVRQAAKPNSAPEP